MALKTDAQMTAVGNYIRNTLFATEVSGLSEDQQLVVSATSAGKIKMLTNKSGLNLEGKFTTAKDGGDANLADWSL
jgi:hypothetical protein